MTTITVKLDGVDQPLDFPWFQDQYLGNLLRNPRPSTLQDIEKDEYWANIMHDYCHAKGAGAEYDAWANAADKNGPEREALKNKQVYCDRKEQDMGVREAFRKDVGLVKSAAKLSRDQQGGLSPEMQRTFFMNSEDEED
jgi:hypothetical protein